MLLSDSVAMISTTSSKYDRSTISVSLIWNRRSTQSAVQVYVAASLHATSYLRRCSIQVHHEKCCPSGLLFPFLLNFVTVIITETAPFSCENSPIDIRLGSGLLDVKYADVFFRERTPGKLQLLVDRLSDSPGMFGISLQGNWFEAKPFSCEKEVGWNRLIG